MGSRVTTIYYTVIISVDKKTLSSWELTVVFAGLLGSAGLYVNVPPRK